MVPGVSYDLQEIYRLVAYRLTLSASDQGFDGVSQTRWERNVRNLLQGRLATGEVVRTARGQYQISGRSSPAPHRPSLTVNRSALTLHRQVLLALGSAVIHAPEGRALKTKPLVTELRPPMSSPAAFFVYLATDHPSERSVGDYRIQVILPGHRMARRAHFESPAGAMPYLVGYVPDFEVFVLWDYGVHDAGDGVPYSKGVQVHAGTIYEAAAVGSSRQERRLRTSAGTATETVIAVRASHLGAALIERDELTVRRLVSGII